MAGAVLHVNDGNNLEAIDAALADAASQSEKPTLIRLRTIIGNPAPTKQDTPEAHGAPLGKEEVFKTKEILHWSQEPFHVAPEAYTEMKPILERGMQLVAEWEARLNARPDAGGFRARIAGELPANWDATLPDLSKDSLASRQASQKALEAIAKSVPALMGGSADLGGKQWHQYQDRRDLRHAHHRPAHALGCPRTWHGRCDERRRRARRLPPLRRHLPLLPRLLQAIGAPRRADETPR